MIYICPAYSSHMTLSIKATYEEPVLMVTVSGKFSQASAKSTFGETLESMAQLQAYRLLVDCRTMILPDSVSEVFEYASFVAESLTRHLADDMAVIPRLAYVFGAGHEAIVKFGETVAMNRGMDLRVFADFDEAHTWLKA